MISREFFGEYNLPRIKGSRAAADARDCFQYRANSWTGKEPGKASMTSKPIQLLLLLILVASLSGCSGILQKRKASERGPKITEEDVRDNQAGGTNEAGEIDPNTGTLRDPDIAGQPGHSVEEPSSSSEPADRPPRRFIWRDGKGSRPSWEPAEDGREAGRGGESPPPSTRHESENAGD